MSAVAPGTPHGGSWDRLTFAGFGALGMWAWFLYGFGPLLPLLRAEQGVSRTVMGLHSLLMSGGAVVAGLVAVPVVRRLQRRGTIRLGTAGMLAGIVGLCSAVSPAVTLPCVLLAGIGGALVINATNAALADHHGPAGAPVLSAGNAVAAGIGLVAPLAVGAGTALGVTWRPATLLVVPLAGLCLLLLHRVPAGWPAIDGDLEHTLGDRSALGRPFWLAFALIITVTGIEFCCTAWSADLLSQRTDLSAASASAAVTLFVGGMFLGRAGGGWLARRYSPPLILTAALVLVLAGWALLWLATAWLPAMVGLGVVGIGMSVQYPLGAALAYAAAPGAGDHASAALSFGIGCAAAIAPFAVGAVADATSTHTAFLVVPLLAGAALGFLALRSAYLDRLRNSTT